jgi:hypothetical protein
MHYFFESIFVGVYTLIIYTLLNSFIINKNINIILFIVGFFKHYLGHYLNLHTYYCNNGYACKLNNKKSLKEVKRCKAYLSVISNLDIFTESFFEGIAFIFIGKFIHTFLVTYLKINNKFLLFFLIGFSLHMLSEILHIHTFFCNNRCA